MDLPGELDSLMDIAIKIDKRLRTKVAFRCIFLLTSAGETPPQIVQITFRPSSIFIVPPAYVTDEPTQLGNTRLPREEHLYRQRDGHCFYCGLLGHQVADCHVKSSKYGFKAAVRVSQKSVIHNPAYFEVKANFHSDTASMLVLIFLLIQAQTLINLSLVRSLGLSQLWL